MTMGYAAAALAVEACCTDGYFALYLLVTSGNEHGERRLHSRTTPCSCLIFPASMSMTQAWQDPALTRHLAPKPCTPA